MTPTKRSILAAVVATSAFGSAAVAFPFTRSWHEPAAGAAGTNRAGAGGLYGTGGRTDHGLKCAHCHTGGAGQIGVTIAAQPPFQTVNGDAAYRPAQRYTITVTMTGEHRGSAASNQNGMAATVEDASGRRAGRLVSDAGQDAAACPTANPYPNAASLPAGRTTFMYGDCHGVLPLPRPGLTAWVFDWVAPGAGAGDLTLFLGVVDGDTGGGSSTGDDTVDRALPLREGT
ncbi:MAG: hypothetical protein R3B06_17970 [Kofleriaceae bacterium]